MSFIILNPLPESLEGISKTGEMIIKNDLSLCIKKEDGSLEYIVGQKYEEFMFFLENQLKSFSGDVTNSDKYIKRFNDADLKSDKIIIYETDKDIIHATDESTLDSYQGCVIRYERNSEPKLLIPATDTDDIVYPHDPENSNNDSFLSDIILAVRTRLTNVENQLPNLLRRDVFNSTMSTKFLQRGSIDIVKYPTLKALTDKLESALADIVNTSNDLTNNYVQRGDAFPIATFPTVQSLITAMDALETERGDYSTSLDKYYMPIGGGYTSSNFLWTSLYVLTTNLENAIVNITNYQNNLPKVLDIGTPHVDYPDVYSLGIKIDAVSDAISSLTTALANMTNTYLYKGALNTTKYANVKVIEDFIKTYVNKNLTKLPAGVGLPVEYNSAYKLESKMNELSTKLTTVINQLANRINKGTTKYNTADEMIVDIDYSVISLANNNTTMDAKLLELDKYKAKGDTPNVPYPNYYTLYQDMTSAQSKLVKMEEALSTKKCLFEIQNKTVFTEMPKICFNGEITTALSLSTRYITGTQTGANYPTRLRPFYFNAYGFDDEGNNGCDSIVETIITKASTNGRYLIKLPWDEPSQGITHSSWEYKDYIWSWNLSTYGLPDSVMFNQHGGDNSTCSHSEYSSGVTRTYSGPRLKPGGIYGWTGGTFACGTIGKDKWLWTINTTGQLIGVNLQAWIDGKDITKYPYLEVPGHVAGASVGDAGFGYYYSPISHVVDMEIVGGKRVFFWAHQKYTTNNNDSSTHDVAIYVGTFMKWMYNASNVGVPQGGMNTRQLTSTERNACRIPVRNEMNAPDTMSFITPLTPNLLFFCNDGYGFFVINDDGSVAIHKASTDDSRSFKQEPIIIRLQDTNLILTVDIRKNKYRICEVEDFDYLDPFLDSVNQEGMLDIGSAGASSVIVAIRDAAVRVNPYRGTIYDSAGRYLPFTGLNDAKRTISYEMDYDGRLVLCVTNLRVKFKVNEKGRPDNIGILL